MAFFFLLVALSLPFWFLGAFGGQLAPGLPISALMGFCPAFAAVILRYREGGTMAARALLLRSLDWPRIRAKVWYWPTLLLMPGAALLSYGILRVAGVPLPRADISLLTAGGMLILFFLGGLGEELGWSGYALDPIQERRGALLAGLLLGLGWALWHYIPLLQAHRSLPWILWWSLGTIATRVLLVWLYNNTGRSVFAVALCHATQNLSWQLFPYRGSHYDPRTTGLVLAFLAIVVARSWGPRKLAHG